MKCNHLLRTLQHCGEPAIVTFDYAGGVGACRKHVGSVALWCMEDDRKLPHKPVTVHPTWQWESEEYRRT